MDRFMETAADSYLPYLLRYPLQQVWSVFLLGLARIVPTIALAPFLGGKSIADPIKLGLSIAIVTIFLPFLVMQSTTPITIDVRFFFLLIKEVFIGAILGFMITMPFYFAQGAGDIIDHQRGSQSLNVMDPTTQVQTSPLGTLFNNMMLIAYFMLGGPMLFFDALFTSYTVLPADQFFSPEFFEGTRPLWVTFIHIISTVFTMTVQLSAPPVIAMLLSDLLLGIINRMAPQVQISFLMWSFKAFIGILLVWLGWWFLLKYFDTLAHNWFKTFQTFVENL